MVPPHYHELHRAARSGDLMQLIHEGGRGSLKSSLAPLHIVIDIMQSPQHNAVALRQVGNTLRDSVVVDINKAIDRLQVGHMWHYSKSTHDFTYKPTGQMIKCRGADDERKLKSTTFERGFCAWMWLEEADQFRGMEQIRSIRQTFLRGGPLTEYWTFNPPKSRDHWINREAERDHPSRFLLKSTYLNVPREWLGDQFFLEAEDLRSLDERSYRHEYLGEATGYGDHVFENVEPLTMSDEMIAQFDVVYNGVDLGWYPDPWAYVRMYYHSATRSLYIFAEETGLKVTTEKQVERITKHLKKRETITMDNMPPQDRDRYRELGLEARAVDKANGYREGSIEWLAKRVAIYIDPERCPLSYQEFRSYQYQSDRQGNVISAYPDANDHTIDAVRYGLQPVIKSRRNV